MSETSTEDFAESHPLAALAGDTVELLLQSRQRRGNPMRMSYANALGAIKSREVFVNNEVDPHGRDLLPRLGPAPRALP
jgi:hypothetical protein